MADQANYHSEDFMAPRKAEEWNRYAHELIKLMHLNLSILYDNVEEISEPSISTTDDLKQVPDDEPFPIVVETFVKHCDSLELLLRTSSKWLVKVPMKSIITVLNRCLKVTATELKFKPLLSELADALPTLHGSALSVMAQLITCCGSNVLPLSRIIIDACFCCLAGSKQAKIETKSIIRGKGFYVLCLMVERFGWGRYLQTLSHLLIPDLIADICTQEAPKINSSTTPTRPKQEVESIAQRKSKKRRKGKKQKGDSYSDLPVCASDNTGNSVQPELFNLEATQNALELSHLVIQRAEFSEVQPLMRSLLNTCKNLQREGLAASSPYISDECRKGLYSAVFSCATVRLGYGCDRKDTISHFQVTNLAMSLLNIASHSDASQEIRKTCNECLMLLRNTGNLNRPIVRRILPDEQVSTKDIIEVEGEAERLKEENKNLWKQLVDTQLEVEAQLRELRQLRETVAHNKAQSNVEHGERKKSEHNNSLDTDNATNGDTVESTDEEKEESQVDDDEAVSTEEGHIDSDSKNENSVQARNKDDPNSSDNPSSHALKFKNSFPKQSVPLPSLAPTKEKNKRSLSEKDDKEGCKKKAKIAETKAENEDIEAMLSDFVDVAPDDP